MESIVCKFGGTSVATKDGLEKVKEIMKDENRKIIVVSAPGKRFPQDKKITDLLIEAHTDKNNFEKNFELIEKRFKEICNILNVNVNLNKEFSKIKLRYKIFKNKSYLFSRGEYLMGKIMAEYLNIKFVDSAKLIKFNKNGMIKGKSYQNIKKAQKKHQKILVPGFYGSGPLGKIKVMSRGGSDITGAICTKAIDNSVYENWTDVDGVYPSKDDIEKRSNSLSEINYNDLEFLSTFGACVLHNKCCKLLQGHKTIIKNTFNSNCCGTTITDSAPSLHCDSVATAYEIEYKDNKKNRKLLKQSKVSILYTLSINGIKKLGFLTNDGYTNNKTLNKLISSSNKFIKTKISARISPVCHGNLLIRQNNQSISIEKTQ